MVSEKPQEEPRPEIREPIGEFEMDIAPLILKTLEYEGITVTEETSEMYKDVWPESITIRFESGATVEIDGDTEAIVSVPSFKTYKNFK